MTELLRKRPNFCTWILCLLGIGLNVLLSVLTDHTGIPFYLDTVGTVTVAMIAGTLPGVFVGFATNMIRALSSSTSIYFGILSVTIALIAAMFVKRGWHKKIGGVIVMVVLFALIGGGIGSLVTWMMGAPLADNGALNDMLLSTGVLGPGIAHLISSILLDLPDKLISTALALLILRLLPEGTRKLFGFRLYMQKTVTEEDTRVDKSGVRKSSLRTKILVALVLSLAGVALACTILSTRVYKDMLVKEHTQLAYGTARLASEFVSADRVGHWLLKRGNTRDYSDTQNRLALTLKGSPEVTYLYVYKPMSDGFHVVFDVETEDTPADEIGTLIPYDQGFLNYGDDFLAGEEVPAFFSNDQEGYLMTVSVPITDSNGNVVCYAFADVNMKDLEEDGQSFLMQLITVFLGFFVMIITFIIWIVDYNLIIPINSVARCMNKMAGSTDSQEQMDADVKIFRSLGIHTGDELEKLYLSASGMTKNQAEQMRSIRRLSDSTAKMQDGLIITMADLVESRDSDTGAHVQKTAAYVKIIANGLKKKGYYPEKLTPKFMSDVVRSAPLHDVGKIHIPDGILNKPGKLTDEEYEIMKTHTTAGKKIMESAISTVEGDNYLKEARNMAAYHHERWDGKGYPEGIHGEVIPLSARIMAVADVFDALTSPRIYKPAFSLEKSISILEEGKGSQFDPKCVEVFLEALPEVKVILRKYNKAGMQGGKEAGV